MQNDEVVATQRKCHDNSIHEVVLVYSEVMLAALVCRYS